jgi:hypothetical protein
VTVARCRVQSLRRDAATEVIDMARGGARNRSGPQADERSARSDQREYRLDQLPAAGFDGAVPEFPLPRRSVYYFEVEDKQRVRVFDSVGTEQVAERERQLWEWLWTTPQACAWSLPSQGWRLHTIAMYVRTFVICEGSDATAADKGSLHRFADQIGMTTAGLAEMGWKITDEAPAEPTGPAPEQDGGSEGGEVVAFERRRG